MEKIGGTLRGIASVANNDVDDPQYIDPSKWKYYSDGAWRQGGKDIIVECIDGIYISVLLLSGLKSARLFREN